MSFSCWKCKKRHAGCHANCEIYKKQKKQVEQNKKKGKIRGDYKWATEKKISAALKASRLKAEKGPVCDEFCKDCYYLRPLYSDDCMCCHYILDTEKMRPCPPGAGCTVKVKVVAKAKK